MQLHWEKERDTRAVFGISAGAKRFRVTPGRPQELISRQQLYGDRCFGNKSSGITGAHTLSPWSLADSMPERDGVPWDLPISLPVHSLSLSLSLSLFYSLSLSLSPFLPACSASLWKFYCRLASFRGPFSIPTAHNQSYRWIQMPGLKAVNSTSRVDISVRLSEETDDLSFSSLTKRFLHFVVMHRWNISLFRELFHWDKLRAPCETYCKKETLLL